MTTTYQNTFEGGTAGAAIPNPTVVGGDAFAISKGASGTNVYTATAGEVINGSTSAKISAGSAENNVFQHAVAATAAGISFAYRPLLPATRTVTHTIARAYNAGGTRGISVTVLAGSSNTSGSVKLSSNNADMITVAGVTFPCVIKACVDPGTSATDGKLKWAIYQQDGVTFNGTGMTAAVEYTGKQTTSGGAITLVTAGFAGTDAEARTATIDDIVVVDSYTLPAGPTNSPPVVSAGATLDVTAGNVASFSSSGTDTGTISTVTGSFTTLPPGVTAPALTGSATGTGTGSAALNQTATLATAGLYVWSAVYTDNSGATSTATQSAYCQPPATAYADPQSVTVGAWVNTGGAADARTALSDTNAATYLEAPQGSPLFIVLPPMLTGAMTIEVSGLYASTAQTRTLTLFMADGVTQVDTISYALPGTDTAYPWHPNDSGLLVNSVALRRALVLKIQDA